MVKIGENDDNLVKSRKKRGHQSSLRPSESIEGMRRQKYRILGWEAEWGFGGQNSEKWPKRMHLKK